MAQKIKYQVHSRMDIRGSSSSNNYTPGIPARGLPFFLEGCGHFYANSGYFTEREGLKNYLLILTLAGSGVIRSKETRVVVGTHDAIILDCSEYQHYQTGDADRWEFLWIHFNGAAAATYYEIMNHGGFDKITTSEEDGLNDRILELLDISRTQDRDLDLVLSDKLTSIITKIVLRRETGRTGRNCERYREEIMKAVRMIEERYAEPLGIEELSSETHISKFYFVRIFKQITGQTPYEYLLFYRINESKSLLLKTILPVSEVAGKCGFMDTSNFIRCFKKATGTTPYSFRKDRLFIL